MQTNYKILVFVALIALLLTTKFYKVLVQKHIGQAQQTRQLKARPDATPPANALESGDHQDLIKPDASLIYTKHARCRMDCRHISEADIREVLREGHVNDTKSRQEEGRCPTYAIEDARNSDGVRLRIVFAKCDTEVKVVTCIDRDEDFKCDCK